MMYIWHDYNPMTMGYVEDWLDEAAIRSTGMDEGFLSFYDYWSKEDGFRVGENFWCKVVFENDHPLAVIAFCRHKENTNIMEILVKPEKRCCGIGTKLLKELLETVEITGFTIRKSEAVIFPDNIASQRAFENAGYHYDRTHADGNALYFVYERSEGWDLPARPRK